MHKSARASAASMIAFVRDCFWTAQQCFDSMFASTIQSCSCLVSTSVVHAGCRRQLEQCEAGCEMEVAVNSGCVLYKEGDYQSAAAKFKEAAALDSGHVVRPSHRRWQWLKPAAVHPSTHDSADTWGPTAATCPESLRPHNLHRLSSLTHRSICMAQK